MSVSGKRGVGIPVIVLHDAEGGIITVELKNGDTYRGLLEEAADNMNFTMKVPIIDWARPPCLLTMLKPILGMHKDHGSQWERVARGSCIHSRLTSCLRDFT